MIWDTSFVIDLMNEDKEAIQKLTELSNRGEQQATTSITVFELFTGMAQSQRPEEEKNKILRVLNGQRILNLKWESAEKAGEIHGFFKKKNDPIKPLDCLIASIAIINNEKLVTRNRKDFEKIQGLELETY